MAAVLARHWRVRLKAVQLRRRVHLRGMVRAVAGVGAIVAVVGGEVRLFRILVQGEAVDIGVRSGFRGRTEIKDPNNLRDELVWLAVESAAKKPTMAGARIDGAPAGRATSEKTHLEDGKQNAAGTGCLHGRLV